MLRDVLHDTVRDQVPHGLSGTGSLPDRTVGYVSMYSASRRNMMSREPLCSPEATRLQ